MATPFPPDMKAYRDVLGRKFLKGSGIEIGAGNVPTAFDPEKASVRYVDYLPIEELRKAYDLPDDWTAPDVVDDGQTLSKFARSSLNFVVANHMIEHTENPIGVLSSWVSKIRKGGLIYVSIPDARYSFDRDRPLTSMEHFIRDCEEGPAWSRDGHFLEFASLVTKSPESEVRAKADELLARDYRIHFHVWNQRSFLDFILMFDAKYHKVEIEHIGRNTTENIAVLRV